MTKTRLLRKASIDFLLTGVIVLLFSGIALYFYTWHLLKGEIEEELYSDKARLESLLKINPDFKGVPPLMIIVPVAEGQPEQLNDTLIFDPSQDEIEEFRQLSGTRLINGQYYKITVRAMTIESEDILVAIVFTFLLIIFMAFVSLFFINRSQNSKRWRPFFINLDRLKNFSLESPEGLKLEASNVVEFDELNRQMLALTKKVRADYNNLKQFTEDVAHEMKTPLAVMQAKIENIINQHQINNELYGQFSSLQQDIHRLKQLNKRLNLLAKIDNHQFVREEYISMAHRMQASVDSFSELFNIRIECTIIDPLDVKMDPYLADVICNNLLSNAVKHQVGDAAIRVSCGIDKLLVSNAGSAPIAHPEKLFTRFYKESKNATSTGLGLAILRKICDRYDFVIRYDFVDGRHTFEIDFKP